MHNVLVGWVCFRCCCCLDYYVGAQDHKSTHDDDYVQSALHNKSHQSLRIRLLLRPPVPMYLNLIEHPPPKTTTSSLEVLNQSDLIVFQSLLSWFHWSPWTRRNSRVAGNVDGMQVSNSSEQVQMVKVKIEDWTKSPRAGILLCHVTCLLVYLDTLPSLKLFGQYRGTPI